MPGHVERDRLELVAARELDGVGPHGRGRPAAARDLRRRLGGALHRVPVELLDVRVARRVPLLHADAEAHRHAARRALQDPLVEDEAAGRPILEEEVGVVPAARRARPPRSLLGERRVDCGAAARQQRGRGRGPSACWVGHVASERTYAEAAVERRASHARAGRTPAPEARVATARRTGAVRAMPTVPARERRGIARRLRRAAAAELRASACGSVQSRRNRAILLASLFFPAPSRLVLRYPRFTPRRSPQRLASRVSPCGRGRRCARCFRHPSSPVPDRPQPRSIPNRGD